MLCELLVHTATQDSEARLPGLLFPQSHATDGADASMLYIYSMTEVVAGRAARGPLNRHLRRSSAAPLRRRVSVSRLCGSLVAWISRLLASSSRSSHATARSWETAGPLAAKARAISPTQRERQGDQHFPLLRYRWLLGVQSELQTL